MVLAKRPRPKRTLIQRFFLLCSLLILSASTVAAILLAYTSETVGQIPRTAFGNALSMQSSETDEPLNFLLIGSDSIANLPEDHPLRWTSGRSTRQLLTDTLIVLRLEPSGGENGEVKASALSIPRDLYVPLSGYPDSMKINSVVYFTNKPTLVQTIQDFLQIPIHHAVEVDFNGFMRLFETLGGLDVYIEYPLRDRKAQLDIPTSGCVSLTPEQALGLVRTRTLQAYVENFDGWYGNAPYAWVTVDGTGDFGRQSRQQDFLILALQQAFDSGFRNPLKISQIIDEILSGNFVTLDDRLTPDNAIKLAQQFKDFRPNQLEKYSLPTVYDFALISGEELSIQRLVESRSDPILDIFRGSVDSNEENAQQVEDNIQAPSVKVSSQSKLDDQITEEGKTSESVLPVEFKNNQQQVFAYSGSENNTMTNEERRAEILERAGKIKGC